MAKTNWSHLAVDLDGPVTQDHQVQPRKDEDQTVCLSPTDTPNPDSLQQPGTQGVRVPPILECWWYPRTPGLAPTLMVSGVSENQVMSEARRLLKGKCVTMAEGELGLCMTEEANRLIDHILDVTHPLAAHMGRQEVVTTHAILPPAMADGISRLRKAWDVSNVDDLASAISSLRLMRLTPEGRDDWCDAVHEFLNEAHRLRCRDAAQGRTPRRPLVDNVPPHDADYLRSTTARFGGR